MTVGVILFAAAVAGIGVVSVPLRAVPVRSAVVEATVPVWPVGLCV